MDPYELGYRMGDLLAAVLGPMLGIALVLAIPALLVIWRIRDAHVSRRQRRRPVIVSLMARREELLRRRGGQT